MTIDSQARDLAFLEQSQNRSVVILVPDSNWFKFIGFVNPIGYFGKPHPGIFILSADNHSNLISLSVDTLIVVGDCQPAGVELAKNMLHCSQEPKMIVVHEPTVIEGKDIWKP